MPESNIRHLFQQNKWAEGGLSDLEGIQNSVGQTTVTLFTISCCSSFRNVQHSSDFNLFLILGKRVMGCVVMSRRRSPRFLCEGASSVMTTQNFRRPLEPLWLHHSLERLRGPGGHHGHLWRAPLIKWLWLGRAAGLPPAVDAPGEGASTHGRAGRGHLGALHRRICQRTVAVISSSFLKLLLLFYSRAAAVDLQAGAVFNQVQHLRHEGRAQVHSKRSKGVWACPGG